VSENTDLLEKGYEAFGRGDMETIRSIWTDDFYWQGPDYEPLPHSGVSRVPARSSRCSGS